MRLGERGEIGDKQSDRIVWVRTSDQGAGVTVIAQDQKEDPLSPYVSLGNFVSLSDQGHIVFMGRLSGGKNALVLVHEGVSHILAEEGQNDIMELELFSPKVNAQGVVAFRAKNSKGIRGIYVASVQGVKKVIGEGDSLESDLGTVKILTREGFPGFAGNVDINDHNQLVFACVLASTEGKIVGDAVYKLSVR